ncbi:cupin domain-containing protein, partial [Bacteriovoracaceae bacterium]|nr:cupin domain-containing protein [Bacteriovoracaceae bacterium]
MKHILLSAMTTLLLSLSLASCGSIGASRYKTTVLSNTEGETKHHAKGASIRILTDKKFRKKTKIFMAELVIPSLGKVPLHRDASDEYLYVLTGKGTIWIDKKPFVLSAGSFVYMPAMAQVQ